MAVATPEVRESVKVTIKVPEHVMDTYRRLAEVERKDLSVVMSERLTDCVEHNAVKGLWFGDEQRREIEHVLGANVSSAAEVTRLVERALLVKVGPCEVPLLPDLLARLQSRAVGVAFDDFLKEIVVRLLSQYSRGMV